MRELDGDAVRLAAVGLVRLGAQDWLSTEGGSPAWVGGVRAASFADAWLAFGDGPASGLRAPAPEVLGAVVARAAELVLRSCGEDGPAALEWLGQRSAEAREQAHREGASHPAEPCALTLVWHGVQALTAEDGPDHARRIEERAEAYVRERHCRQDTLALVLCCTRIAAAALVELCEGDPERVACRLEQDAARSMPRVGRVPLWVPG
ncbi:hypothetical protein ACFU6K_24995, partial [Kitasatospora sp. NPDC057512]|uniref:hypothetical protein n=1 Tax=Kitasatospora sp. NPDC057512 TaxID=3346154 RepID=UPI0036C43D3A